MTPLPSWLDHVTTCPTVYVWHAALICEDCIKKIIPQLLAEGRGDTGDSVDFPQGPYNDGGGEADSAQFCDSGPNCLNCIPLPGGRAIGCPLDNPLTTEGQATVMASIVRSILNKDEGSRMTGRLLMKLYGYLKPPELVRVPGHATPKLKASLQWLVDNDHTDPLLSEFYTDLVYLYGGSNDPRGNKVTLWRLEITAKGGFTDLSMIHLPGAESPARTFEDMIDEAWQEGGWE